MVVNISTREERTFLLDSPDLDAFNARFIGPTVGALRAAVMATRDFVATGAGQRETETERESQAQVQGGARSFELVVGTDPPLADDLPLSQAARQGVILLIPSA